MARRFEDIDAEEIARDIEDALDDIRLEVECG